MFNICKITYKIIIGRCIFVYHWCSNLLIFISNAYSYVVRLNTELHDEWKMSVQSSNVVKCFPWQHTALIKRWSDRWAEQWSKRRGDLEYHHSKCVWILACRAICQIKDFLLSTNFVFRFTKGKECNTHSMNIPM